MVDINDIKSERITIKEKILRTFLLSDIGNRTVYHIRRVGNHAESYIVMDNKKVIYKVFRNYVVIDYNYIFDGEVRESSDTFHITIDDIILPYAVLECNSGFYDMAKILENNGEKVSCSGTSFFELSFLRQELSDSIEW